MKTFSEKNQGRRYGSVWVDSRGYLHYLVRVLYVTKQLSMALTTGETLWCAML